MNAFPMILDGSKFEWSNGRACDGITSISDHPGFPKGGRPPRQVAVRSHRTGWIMVFNFVDVGDDGEGGVALNYMGTLPDGRHCDLSLWAE